MTRDVHALCATPGGPPRSAACRRSASVRCKHACTAPVPPQITQLAQAQATRCCCARPRWAGRRTWRGCRPCSRRRGGRPRPSCAGSIACPTCRRACPARAPAQTLQCVPVSASLGCSQCIMDHLAHMKTVLAKTSARSGVCEVRATRRRKACTAVRAGMRSQALVGPQGGAPGAAGSSADACEVFYTSETGLHALDSGARLLVVFEPVLHSSHDVLPAGSASALL